MAELPEKCNPNEQDSPDVAKPKKKKKGPSSGSEYYLKENNVKKMIDAAKSLRNRLVIRLLDVTGGRRFEVRDMRIKDIDFENKRIWIDLGKGGDPTSNRPEERRSRWVDIDDPELIAELKMYIGNRTTGKIIQSNCKEFDGIDSSGINRIVTNTAKIANIKSPNPSPKKIRGGKLVERHVSPHLFRHTMGRRDMSLSAKQKLLGHRDARTTMQMYGKLTFEDAQKLAKEAREKTKKETEKKTGASDKVIDKFSIIERKCKELGISPKDFIDLVKNEKI